ncbi:proton myo-inositol cotransporter-like [Aphidius gifuensis]|nr:proton myo-inositol cotransporter-like [Aphidius gifuensis]XP_044002401.1 proton myo-inositol cotransporter-like [Aphidius gifuensis]XP_044002402.1 proton myo-inositol cotransporter-like [Aphidius gifuensis]XP_044002404.1 proton myo-inositol cotransporter-like [Aphidius gifuensis]XP_044002405.1 proton myo-inositol cotransporter-like [Aphidius gifuensis]
MMLPKNDEKKNQSQYKQWLAAIVATLSMVAVGTVYGWTTTMELRITGKIENYKVPIVVTRDEFSWIVSLVQISAMIGSFLGAFIADYFGRKFSLLCSSIFFSIGWLFVIFGNNVFALYASRIILGIGVGMSYTTNPMYVSEVADTNIRGALGTLIAINVFTGSLFTCCIAPWTSYMTTNLILLSIPVIFFILFLYFPESPYYLIKKKRYDDAKSAICFFKNCSNNEAQEKYNEIRENINDNKLNYNDSIYKNIKRLLSSNNRKAFLIVFGLIMAQQMSGNFSTMQYLTSLFEKSKIQLIDTDVATIIVFAVGLISGVVATATVEKAGRRKLLNISSSFCAIILAILAFYLLHINDGKNDDEKSYESFLSLLPLIAVILFQVFYQSGLGTLPNALIGELFPTSAKGIAGAALTISDGIIGFITSKLYQIIGDTYGQHYNYFLFSGACFLAFFLIFIYVPETKNKTFVQIQDDLKKNRIFCC